MQGALILLNSLMREKKWEVIKLWKSWVKARRVRFFRLATEKCLQPNA